MTFKSTHIGSTFTEGYAVAGVNGVSTQFMLTKGSWDLTFEAPTSKLLLVSLCQSLHCKYDTDSNSNRNFNDKI